MTIRLDGLQSGMDTTALIKSILDSQRIPNSRKEDQITSNEDKIYAWNQLDTKVTDLNSKAVKLNTFSVWNQRKSTFSTEGIATASASRTANKGTYSLVVDHLAQAHRIASDSKTDTTSALGLTGDFTLGGKIITVTNTDTLKTLRDKINEAAEEMDADKKVNASLVGTSLVLERDKTGDTDIVLTDGTGDILKNLGILTGTGTLKHELQTSENLDASVNGVDVGGTENTGLTEIIEGVTLNFTKAGSTTLDIANDKDSIKQLIKDFITAYNDAMALAEEAGQVTLSDNNEEVTTLGMLQGDSLLSQMRSRSRIIATSLETNPANLDQDFNTLSKIGIWTTGRENRLEITDEDALDSALENNFEEVEDLFRDYQSGVAQKMVKYTDSLISPIEGQLQRRIKGLEDRNTSLQKEIDNFELVLKDRETNLYEQFSRMEQQMASIQSQGNYVLNSLGTTSSSKK